MSLILIMAAIGGSLIAILPAFLIFLYIARFKGRMWLSAIIGGCFWLIALLARTPILVALEFWALTIPPAFYVAFAAIMIFLGALLAGLFEEGIKYGFLKRAPRFVDTVKHALCFGLGWGLCEALLLYVLTVLLYGFLYEWLITIVTLPPESVLIWNFMAGAVERNTAILFHVSATIIVALAVWHQRFFFAGLAILTHFLFDFIPLILLQFVFYPFLTSAIALILVESLFAGSAVVIAVLANYLLKREGGPPKLEPEPDTEIT
ncbi:MAG: YhfC family glutamic-type intramembrane protease [Promethearchaeota archaeon]